MNHFARFLAPIVLPRHGRHEGAEHTGRTVAFRRSNGNEGFLEQTNGPKLGLIAGLDKRER